jgi:hypothetical protein
MDENPDCANASIEEANISKLIHFHLSILFAMEIFITRTDLMRLLYESAISVNHHHLEWDIETYQLSNLLAFKLMHELHAVQVVTLNLVDETCLTPSCTILNLSSGSFHCSLCS